MNAKEYLDHHGPAKTEATAKEAGTNLAYFRQIAYGHRNASMGLAKRLVKADSSLDLLSLLDATSQKDACS